MGGFRNLSESLGRFQPNCLYVLFECESENEKKKRKKTHHKIESKMLVCW